jgi:glycosyltransferase involved in cell wall biosynthesis
MRIGLDVSQVVFPGTGVGRYTRELVTALLKVGPENEYVLFGSSLRRLGDLRTFAAQIALPDRVIPKFYPLPPTIAEPIFNVFPRPVIDNFIGSLDVLQTSDWLEPRSRAPKVTVVHDLAMFRYPEIAQPKILATHKRKLDLVKKEDRAVIAVSVSTKKDLVELLGFSPKKIAVIYEAANRNFKPVGRQLPMAIASKCCITQPYILALGTREPRKNLKRIMAAFARLGTDTWQLVIVGNFGWGEDIKPQANVVVTGFVADEELPALYSGAEVFVYPALYEGFGLPVLEAMQCGTPVVTANIASLPEVAGDAAVLVEPTSTEAIASGIKKALGNRRELIAKGHQQAKKFSWEETARQTLAVYKSIV